MSHGPERRLRSTRQAYRPYDAPSPSRRARPAPGNAGLGLDAVAGDDPTMQANVAMIRRVIDGDVPFLLLGDTGTGKEVLARAIHAEGPRQNGPFVVVDCAALPDTLIESELFGYAPGTFTGARRDGHRGKVLAAHGGTLFLDEIGDMPLALQSRLLRLLAEGEVTPLGGDTPRKVDVTVICATHRDLAHMVTEGRFRQDLYFRVRGAEISLPRLRERADLATLIASVLERECGSHASIDPALIDALAAHDWPGNVRELVMAARLAAGLAVGEPLRLEHFVWLRQSPAPQWGTTIGDNDAEALRAALKRHGWRVSKTARALGVSRSTLHRRMRALKISRPT